MAICDETVFIIDTTTPLTDMQWASAQLMFSDKKPNRNQVMLPPPPQILVLPLILTFTNDSGISDSRYENQIGEVSTSIERLLADPKRKPVGTSQPSGRDFAAVFKRADELGYKNAICLFLPTQLSRTCENAQAAALGYMGTNLKNIYIPLSNFGSGELTLTLDQLMGSEETDFEGLKRQADWLTNNARMWLVPDNLERLHESGRISDFIYRAGSLLNIHPIISVGKAGKERGNFISEEKIRTTSNEKIASKLAELAADYLRGKGRSKACVIDRNMTDLAYIVSELASEALGYNVPIVTDVSNIIYKVVGPAVALDVLPVEYRD